MIKRKTKKPSRQAGTRLIEKIKMPKREDWNNIVHDLELNAAQLSELKMTIYHAVNDIADSQSIKRQKPERALATPRLKRMERALGELQREIDRSIHLMGHFLPHETMAHIGRSFTFSAIVDAVGEKLRPRESAPVAIRTPATGNQMDVIALDEATRSRRETLGRKHGHQILKHFIDAIHAHLKNWVEEDKLNKGGRPPPLDRTHLIRCLARDAPGIIGKPAPISTTGPFAILCGLLLPACGLSARGVEGAIPRIVREVRAEQKRWLAEEGAS